MIVVAIALLTFSGPPPEGQPQHEAQPARLATGAVRVCAGASDDWRPLSWYAENSTVGRCVRWCRHVRRVDWRPGAGGDEAAWTALLFPEKLEPPHRVAVDALRRMGGREFRSDVRGVALVSWCEAMAEQRERRSAP